MTINNPAAWAKANPALGSIKKLDDLTAIVERAKQNRNELSGVLCKEFNVRETVKTAWLSFDDINNEIQQTRAARRAAGLCSQRLRGIASHAPKNFDYKKELENRF